MTQLTIDKRALAISPTPAVTEPHANRPSASHPVDIHAHAIITAPMANIRSDPIANLRSKVKDFASAFLLASWRLSPGGACQPRSGPKEMVQLSFPSLHESLIMIGRESGHELVANLTDARMAVSYVSKTFVAVCGKLDLQATSCNAGHNF